MSQVSNLSIPSVVLGELVDKGLFIPLVVGLVVRTEAQDTLDPYVFSWTRQPPGILERSLITCRSGMASVSM